MKTLNQLIAQDTNVIPEFQKPKGVALVYPDKLPDTRYKLTGFYDSFIQSLLECSGLSEITIIHRPGLKESLSKKFSDKRINLIVNTNIQDIWIRDWGAIASTPDKVIKAYYSPAYFPDHEKKYAHLDDQAGYELFTKLNLKTDSLICRNEKLILDGGNFIHNGNGIGITTNRIIADNESFSINQIREAFQEQLGIKKLIVVPVEPGDKTGHIDGMVRFINQKTVVVASYLDDYPEGKNFLDSLADQLRQDFKIVRVTNEIPKDQKLDDFPSAFGNYINYFRVEDKIFLPKYGIDKDTKARQEYEKFFNVIPVSKDIEKLADLGGVLNCITWTYY